MPQGLLIVKKFMVRDKNYSKTRRGALKLNNTEKLVKSWHFPALPPILNPFRADLFLEATDTTKSSHYNLLKAFLPQTKNIPG